MSTIHCNVVSSAYDIGFNKKKWASLKTVSTKVHSSERLVYPNPMTYLGSFVIDIMAFILMLEKGKWKSEY